MLPAADCSHKPSEAGGAELAGGFLGNRVASVGFLIYLFILTSCKSGVEL